MLKQGSAVQWCSRTRGTGRHLVGEQLAVVLRGQVRLGGLRAVQLQALADALAQHVQRRVGLHSFTLGQPDPGSLNLRCAQDTPYNHQYLCKHLLDSAGTLNAFVTPRMQ